MRFDHHAKRSLKPAPGWGNPDVVIATLGVFNSETPLVLASLRRDFPDSAILVTTTQPETFDLIVSANTLVYFAIWKTFLLPLQTRCARMGRSYSPSSMQSEADPILTTDWSGTVAIATPLHSGAVALPPPAWSQRSTMPTCARNRAHQCRG